LRLYRHAAEEGPVEVYSLVHGIEFIQRRRPGRPCRNRLW
jgi:hypothetical protein